MKECYTNVSNANNIMDPTLIVLEKATDGRRRLLAMEFSEVAATSNFVKIKTERYKTVNYCCRIAVVEAADKLLDNMKNLEMTRGLGLEACGYIIRKRGLTRTL